jgi:hypothetical protein
MKRGRLSDNIDRETRVRQLAAGEGLRLHKLRDQDDEYWLVDDAINGLILGNAVTRGIDTGCPLADVEDWLRSMTD